MTPDELTDGNGFTVSTSSADAVAAYTAGVELLTGSPAEALGPLRDAVDADPGFELARVALACACAATGSPSATAQPDGSPASSCRAITRRERQHVEIVRLVLNGEHQRAAVLGREHLREFPSDALVRHILHSYGIA